MSRSFPLANSAILGLQLLLRLELADLVVWPNRLGKPNEK